VKRISVLVTLRSRAGLTDDVVLVEGALLDTVINFNDVLPYYATSTAVKMTDKPVSYSMLT
jgi:hypothetical protein